VRGEPALQQYKEPVYHNVQALEGRLKGRTHAPTLAAV